ncbi:MAG: hypothetical protein HYY50_01935 [Candidatus Kerfeldbacteria bacterium]|nr:hypothetical protein [Candidatus Kerfeldbacteria bacterium]
MDAYDQRAQELLAAEIINLPEKAEVESNPEYQPTARVTAIAEAISAFPFARTETKERMLDLVNSKAKGMGLDLSGEARQAAGQSTSALRYGIIFQ